MTDFKQPDTAFLRSIDIHELLPQQEPFVMVSRLVRFDMIRTTTETDILADNIFVENGCLSASGLSALPQIGDTIVTNVDVKEELFGMILAEATIYCGDKQLVTTEMKIAIKSKEE